MIQFLGRVELCDITRLIYKGWSDTEGTRRITDCVLWNFLSNLLAVPHLVLNFFHDRRLPSRPVDTVIRSTFSESRRYTYLSPT